MIDVHYSTYTHQMTVEITSDSGETITETFDIQQAKELFKKMFHSYNMFRREEFYRTGTIVEDEV